MSGLPTASLLGVGVTPPSPWIGGARRQREKQQQQSRTGFGFRPDIEGLRGVALLAALLYHAGVPFASGGYVGVDMFFVISGYLITGLLVAEIQRDGSISLTRFYTRRIRRLLPAAVFALLAVVALSWVSFSPVRREEVSWDVIASGLYFINWRLAQSAVDYFTVGWEASPLQHYWSLAIEEQFYIVWPLLLLAVVWFVRRTGRGLYSGLWVALSLVTISSLWFSYQYTEKMAAAAYFFTPARGWELALGGLLALLPLSRIRVPRGAAVLLAWAGIAAILWAVVRFDENTLFPGTAALIPVLGTAAIIAAGSFSGAVGSLATLEHPVVRHVGQISYSWYLWHWIVLVFVAQWLGGLSATMGFLVAMLSWLPSVFSYYVIERPFRESQFFGRNRRAAFQLGAVCTSAAVMFGLILTLAAPKMPEAPASAVSGGDLRKQKVQERVQAVRPVPEKAEEDRGMMSADGCLVPQGATKSPKCVYGDPKSDTTVVLFGDSHAMHYFPALNALAEKHGWRLVGLTKSACPPAKTTVYNTSFRREYTECDVWRKNTLNRIKEEEKPDLIVAGSMTTHRTVERRNPEGKTESAKKLTEGYVETLKELRDTGAEVVVMRDVPRLFKDVPDCVSRFPDNLDRCAIAKNRAFNYPQVGIRAAEKADAHVGDITPLLCADGKCPAVIGNALVYRQSSHLTATYARTLAPWLERQLTSLAN